MSRPRVNGPRSLIITIVVAPVRGFVTFTRVPNGSFLCAAVRPSGRRGSPLAVPEPKLYWVAFIEPLRQSSWGDAARTAPLKQIETSNTGMVSTSLIDKICLLSRRLSDIVSRNGEQGHQRKTGNPKLLVERRLVRQAGDQEGRPERRTEMMYNEGGTCRPHCLEKMTPAPT
jgi:hypothetical protein